MLGLLDRTALVVSERHSSKSCVSRDVHFKLYYCDFLLPFFFFPPFFLVLIYLLRTYNRRRAQVTVSVDAVRFLAPGRKGDNLLVAASINRCVWSLPQYTV